MENVEGEWEGDTGHEPVPAGNNSRVGTFGVGHCEEPLRLVDGRLVRPLWQKVGG